MNAPAEQVATEATEGLQNTHPGVVLGDHTVESSNDAQNVKAEGLNSELASKWLIWQCKMIADVITCLLYTSDAADE